jgi:putative membrane protein
MEKQIATPDPVPVRPPDPAIRPKAILLVAFVVAWAGSCIRPPYPSELVLQHIPTVVAIIGLVFADHRWRFSLGSFAQVLAFLGLHLLGARYLYSNVPYDDWTGAIFGAEISTQFGWERNHYDRLVHLAYGLLLVGPCREGLVRGAGVRGVWSHALAVSLILATSAGYELLEGLVAVVLDPAEAEAYNGQQGDMWDAQKDMALALLGAVVSTALVVALEATRSKRPLGPSQSP